MVTCCSFIASSSADCVFGVARLISSASRKLVKIGPCLNSNSCGVGVINGDAEHVARQHVGGELQAVKTRPDAARQSLRQRGFAHAWHVFDQQMAARQQAGERQAQHFRLAANRFAQSRLDFGYLGKRNWRAETWVPLDHHCHDIEITAAI